MENTDEIYVVELHAFQQDLTSHVSWWTHASHDMKKLEKFVEEIMYPNPEFCPMKIMKLKFQKFVRSDKQHNSELHHGDHRWITSNIDDPENLHPQNDGNLFGVNLAIDNLHFSKTQTKIKESKKQLKTEFSELWKSVEEKLEGSFCD